MKELTRLLFFASSLFLLTLGLQAQALTLGQLRVLSTLGQPIAADIEVFDVSEQEAKSVQVAIASAQDFKAASLDYLPAISTAFVNFAHKGNGRFMFEVRGSQPISTPFVDLILDIKWSSGRILKDYALLFEGQSTGVLLGKVRKPLPLSLTNPPLSFISPHDADKSNASGMGAPLDIEAKSASASNATVLNDAVTPSKTSGQEPLKSSGDSQKPFSAPLSQDQKLRDRKSVSHPIRVRVKKGDTASSIAASHALLGVSLDQMLVEILRNNPKAFINGNINQLKSKSSLSIPSSPDALAISANEAEKIVEAQARDFESYRNKLAQNALRHQQPESDHHITGKVTGHVSESRVAPLPEDQLKLAKSKGLDGAKVAVEDQLAKAKSESETLARSKELNRNVSDLAQIAKQLSPLSSAALSPSQAPSAQVSLSPSVAVGEPVAAARLNASAPTLVPKGGGASFFEKNLSHPMALAMGLGLLGVFSLFVLWLRRLLRSTHRQNDRIKLHFEREFDPVNSLKTPDTSLLIQPVQSFIPNTVANASLETQVYTDAIGGSLGRVTQNSIPNGDSPLSENISKQIDASDYLISDVPSDGISELSNNVSVVASVEAQPALIPFDFSSLSLDLPTSKPSLNSSLAGISQTESQEVAENTAMNALATAELKLAMAEERLVSGYVEEARALINEVLAQQIDGHTAALAQQMLMRIA